MWTLLIQCGTHIKFWHNILSTIAKTIGNKSETRNWMENTHTHFEQSNSLENQLKTKSNEIRIRDTHSQTHTHRMRNYITWQNFLISFLICYQFAENYGQSLTLCCHECKLKWYRFFETEIHLSNTPIWISSEIRSHKTVSASFRHRIAINLNKLHWNGGDNEFTISIAWSMWLLI